MGAGEAILVNIVTEILKKLGSPAFEEINLAKGVKEEVEKLKITIGLIQDVISDAENKQVKEKSVGNWLKQLKDLAYEADDILGEYAYDLMHQRLNRQRDQVSSFFSKNRNPIARSLKMGHKIKDLNQNFDELATQRVELGLKVLNLGSSSHRETHAFVDESKVLGREVDKSNIINMLLANKSSSSCNQNDKISVIPIVGMGGLGKTALAQLVYNDTVVENHFDLKIWVCVSEVFDVKKIFLSIIESLPGKKIDAVLNPLNIIDQILQQRLVGNRFLLVLDDVWNENTGEWNKLKVPLMAGAEGSKIVVTTRSETVARIVRAGEFPSYKLQTLEDDNCLSIFEQRAFGPSCKAIKKTPTLVEIGKQLVRKCGGLPLALEALGSLMHSKKEVWEWEAIRDSKIWDNNLENPNKIPPALKLSYDHLSPQVKSCFSYCSMFLKESEIERETLIRLWVAEGFIQPFEGDERLMEEIGNGYFNNLLWNSFFQGVSPNKDGEITKFKMHDLIHDLAQSVAGTHECSIMESGEMGDISEFRRLNLLNVNEESSAATATVVSKSKLRTLFIKGGRIANYDSLINNNKRLRVLDLSGSDIEELPPSIGDLKHLRYLDLSYCENLKKLPNSITRLYNLQTLKLNGCRDLKKFPNDLNTLINLRHLLHDVSDWQLEVGQLTCLQTLRRFDVSKDNGGSGVGGGIGELQCLNLLGGKLEITGLNRVRGRENAEKANLKAKKSIKELNLYWRFSDEGEGVEKWGEEEFNNDSLVLEGLQPHPNLRKLGIFDFMGPKFPTWMSSSSLHTLRLLNCPNLTLLSGNLRGLTSLRELDVRNTPGLMFLPLGLLKGNNVLEHLYVHNCPDFQGFIQEEDLSVLSSSSNRSSSLHTLELDNCPVLRLLPDLKDLTSLQNVTIQGCNEDLVISLPNGVVNRIFKFVTLEKFKVPINTTEGISESEGLTISEGIAESEGLTYGGGQIENLERVKDGKKADKENLKQTQNIKRVALTWNDETMLDEDHDSNNDSLVLEGLRPHPSLRSLVITCFMVPTFPKWMGDPLCLPNLVELELHSCNRCEQLPALGKLPFLRLLIVRGMIAIKRLGREFYYRGGEGSILLSEEAAISFPSLNELVLDDMPNLEEWVEPLQPKFSTSSFPLLESIEIKLCPKLKSIPILFPSLENLEFYSSNGTSLSSVVNSNLGSLVSLYVKEVPRLFFLPQGLLTNNNVLQSLDIYDCPDFQGFIHQGEEMELFNSNSSSLQFLTILDCPVLTFLPGIRGMTSLQRLTILDCNKELNILPDDLECLSSLEEFEFGSSHPNGIEEAEE